MRLIRVLSLALLATVADADVFSSVTVSDYVSSIDGSLVPGCGGLLNGTFSAHVSLACDLVVTGFNGSPLQEHASGGAYAATAIGPYGIGATLDLGAYVYPIFPISDVVYSAASFSWSETVLVSGPQGNGTALISVSGRPIDHPWSSFDLELFGQTWDVWDDPFVVPITFGVPYTLQMSGSTFWCESMTYEDCLGPEVYVSGISFFDENGTPLPDARLVDLPEVSSWLLLSTCFLATIVSRLSRRSAKSRVWHCGLP